jgi:hypothetical protein
MRAKREDYSRGKRYLLFYPASATWAGSAPVEVKAGDALLLWSPVGENRIGPTASIRAQDSSFTTATIVTLVTSSMIRTAAGTNFFRRLTIFYTAKHHDGATSRHF